MFELPDISALGGLSYEEKAGVLDNLFEPCETLTKVLIERLFTGKSFNSYKELIETSRFELLEYLKEAENESRTSGDEIRPEISKIIAAHPRLGAPKTTKLSDHSSSEQKSLQGSSEESEKLAQLNKEYESTFPGLRYVVFVNGRSRAVVMDNMRQRIDRNDIKLERIEAFNAMCDIALDRAKKLGAKL
ncbi:hypothetical protein CLIB1444_02S05512 [[Candida] jaroonii]|uniref:Uncharacterized protein n=1 Tax=[Candida] jaroonii TaxID=467808 RepID=A0ACA9Y318_9ASCO|nr:hypothetical protein CLIB1444_02S05512 [[Candida] jaroonii]